MEIRHVQHRPFVILVDDDPAVRSSLKFSLELDGFAVQTHADAASVLGAQGIAKADCLIIDYRLPGLDGLELVAQLRTRDVCAPVILITTNPSQSLRDRARQTNIRIIEKPLLGDALIEELRRICNPNGGSA